MQYNSYQKRILKIAKLLGRLYSHIVPISIAAAVVTATAVTLAATKGMPISHGECPAEVIYGDVPAYEAGSFLGGEITYEYAPAGTDEWSAEPPMAVGEYMVRSVGVSSFGNPKYGKVQSFTIKPREISVFANAAAVTYGEQPAATAEGLLKGHSVLSCEFLYEDNVQVSTKAYAVAETLKIVDAEGEDVTANYTVTDTPKKDITIAPKDISVIVDSASKIYDNTVLTCSGFELGSIPLVGNDVLVAVKDNLPSITDVGSVSNKIEFRVVNADGVDISAKYSISVTAGTLSVEKKVIDLTSESFSAVYDGTEKSHAVFTFDNAAQEKFLADNGHRVEVVTNTSSTDVIKTDNILTFKVTDKYGNDKTDNYSVLLARGTFEITKRPVTVTTGSATYLYDAEAHAQDSNQIDGLPSAEYEIELSIAPTFTDVKRDSEGNVIAYDNNRVVTDITYNGASVLHNFDVNVIFGEIKITPIEIHPSIALKDDKNEYFYGEEIELETSYVGAATTPLSGHALKFDTQKHMNVGEHQITVSNLGIYSEVGKDVTSNYNINLQNLTPINVTIKQLEVRVVPTASIISKEYDGTPFELGYNLCKADGTTLLNIPYGDSAKVTFNEESQGKDVGTFSYYATAISVSSTIGADVTGNYKLWTNDEGITDKIDLEITEKSVELQLAFLTPITRARAVRSTPEPLTWTYGSAPTYIHEKQIDLAGDLKAKLYIRWNEEYSTINRLKVVSEDRRQIGTIEVIFEGKDDTSNYNITIDGNSLDEYTFNVNYTITERSIEIIGEIDSFTYDGIENTYKNPTISGERLVEDQSLVLTPQVFTNVSDSGDLTYGGKDSFKIMDGNEDVTNNYIITFTPGTITVDPRPVTIIGTPQSDETYRGNANPYRYVNTDVLEADGLVKGHSFNTSTTEISKTYAGTYDLDFGNVTIFDGNFEVTGNYAIAYEYSTLTINKLTITVTASETSHVFDGTAEHRYSVDNSDIENALDEETYSIVYYPIDDNGNYAIEAREYKVAFEISIEDAKGDTSDNYIIKYKWNDDTYDDESSCKYTINKRPITITGKTSEFIYDGIDHYIPYNAEGNLTVGGNYGLVSGHDIASTESVIECIDVETYTLNYGYRTNTFQIMDGDTPVTDNYEIIEFTPAKVVITHRKITVVPLIMEHTYDGLEDTDGYRYTYTYENNINNNDDYGRIDGELLENQIYTVGYEPITVMASEGGVNIDMSVTITDNKGNNTSGNYEITYKDASGNVKERTEHGSYPYGYVIHRAPLKVILHTLTSVYNGKTPSYTAGTDGLVGIDIGKSIKYTVQGSNYGTYKVTVNMSMEVVDNYKKTYVDSDGVEVDTAKAIYTIEKRKIWIKTPEIPAESIVFDGKHYEFEPELIVEGEYLALADRHRFQCVTYDCYDAKEYTLDFGMNSPNAFHILTNSGSPVENNYDIKFVAATFEITKRPITITAQRDTLVYDGITRVYEIEGAKHENLVVGHRIASDVAYQLKDADTYILDYKYSEGKVYIFDAADNNVTNNYSVTFITDTVVIEKAKITVTGTIDQHMFDGTIPVHSYKNGDVTIEVTYGDESLLKSNHRFNFSYWPVDSTMPNSPKGCLVGNNYGVDSTGEITNFREQAASQNFDITVVFPETYDIVKRDLTIIFHGDKYLVSEPLRGEFSVGSTPNGVYETTSPSNGYEIVDGTHVYTYDGNTHYFTAVTVNEQIEGMMFSFGDDFYTGYTNASDDVHTIGMLPESIILEKCILVGEVAITSCFNIELKQPKVKIIRRTIKLVPSVSEVTYGVYESFTENGQVITSNGAEKGLWQYAPGSLKIPTNLHTLILSTKCGAHNCSVCEHYAGDGCLACVGEHTLVVDSYKVSGYGAVANNYALEYFGEIVVTTRNVTLKPKETQSKYTGSNPGKIEVNVSYPDQFEGIDDFDVYCELENCPVTGDTGFYDLKYFISITRDGNVINEGNYNITISDERYYIGESLVTISPSVEIKSYQYDGSTELPIYEWYTAEGLKEGHKLEFYLVNLLAGNATDIGKEFEVGFGIIDTNNNNADVTANYDQNTTGKAHLKIIKRTLTIFSEGGEYLYNGDVQVQENLKHNDPSELLDGHSIVLTGSAVGAKDIGVHTNEFSEGWSVKVNEGGVDVTNTYYEIIEDRGRVIIYVNVKITGFEPQEKTYDKTKLYPKFGFTVSADSEVPDTFKFESTVSIEDAGSFTAADVLDALRNSEYKLTLDGEELDNICCKIEYDGDMEEVVATIHRRKITLTVCEEIYRVVSSVDISSISNTVSGSDAVERVLSDDEGFMPTEVTIKYEDWGKNGPSYNKPYTATITSQNLSPINYDVTCVSGNIIFEEA